MTLNTPCSDPANNSDDWFIGRDGKQYPSDDLLTQEQIDAAVKGVELTPADDGYVEAVDKALDRAEADAKREALQRRRHARDKCHETCYFRMNCLDRAIEGDQQHGTWGGYYEEEVRAIRLEITRRKRGKAPRD